MEARPINGVLLPIRMKRRWWEIWKPRYSVEYFLFEQEFVVEHMSVKVKACRCAMYYNCDCQT